MPKRYIVLLRGGETKMRMLMKSISEEDRRLPQRDILHGYHTRQMVMAKNTNDDWCLVLDGISSRVMKLNVVKAIAENNVEVLGMMKSWGNGMKMDLYEYLENIHTKGEIQFMKDVLVEPQDVANEYKMPDVGPQDMIEMMA